MAKEQVIYFDLLYTAYVIVNSTKSGNAGLNCTSKHVKVNGRRKFLMFPERLLGLQQHYTGFLVKIFYLE